MKIWQVLIELINHVFRLIQKHEQSEHEKRKQAAKNDPAEYFNSLDGMRDKSKDDADSARH